jgi:hypothetical protein
MTRCGTLDLRNEHTVRIWAAHADRLELVFDRWQGQPLQHRLAGAVLGDPGVASAGRWPAAALVARYRPLVLARGALARSPCATGAGGPRGG